MCAAGPLLIALLLAPWAGAAEQAPAHKAAEALALTGKNARVESGKKFFGDTRYAGSDGCKSCHESQYQSWANSWHSKMERWPTPAAVVGDFDNRRIQFRNLRVRSADGKDATINPTALAFRQGDRYYFTLFDKDDAANNQTWEVAKLLGGKWDQGYEVRLGPDNFFPAPIRWSVLQKDWIVGGFNPADWFIADGTPDGRPFKPAKLRTDRVAEAKCNGCHMTGYTYAQGSDGMWKSRMLGKGEIAVACEACHGPGARHVEEAEAARRAGIKLVAGKTAIVNPLTDLIAEQAAQVCGQCHARGAHKETTDLHFPTGFLPGDTDLTTRYRPWSFSGTNAKSESDYFWPNDWASRNRQQYQDFTKSAHSAKAGMSCITCHAFHGRTEGPQLRSKPEQLCEECHRAGGRSMRPNAEMYAGSDMDQAGVICVDCHMPRIGSRSRATSKSGHQWDSTSHVFAVPTPLMEKTLGVRSSCTSCHVDDAKPIGTPATATASRSMQQQLIDDMRSRADEVRNGVAEAQALLERADLRKTGVAPLVYEAQAKLGFIVADNSKGAHNIGQTRKLLREAKALAQRALALQVAAE